MHNPMRERRSAAESALALFARPERAAAIYGDLVEMAGSRGRLWFAAAYVRTLFSLTWRIVLALVAAIIGRQILVNSFHTYMARTPSTWRTGSAPFLLNSMGPFLALIAETLWFVLPFAAVRYGVRDRFVQLTFAVAAGASVVFLFLPWASLLCAFATLAIAAAALFTNIWRRPMVVLLWTGAAAFVAMFIVGCINSTIIAYHHDWWTSHFFRHYGAMLIYRSSLLFVAAACSLLHRRLLDQPAAGDRTLA